MDLDDIKRGLRAEIKKRENEQYFTFQCNVRQMCKDVLAKLEEHESVLAEKDKEIAELEERIADGDKDFEMANHQNEWLLKIVRHHKFKRCLAMARMCLEKSNYHFAICCRESGGNGERHSYLSRLYSKWYKHWLKIAEQFKDKETK